MKKILRYFLTFFVLNMLILMLTHGFDEFENGVYLKYLYSIVKDGDFNIFNQFQGQFDRWMVTPTFNHFDYHSPFFSSLLIVPYFLFKLFAWNIPQNLPFWGNQLFITLVLLAFVFVIQISKEIKLKQFTLLGLMILGTVLMGGIWNLLFEPSELSFIQLIFSLIIFHELYLLFDDKKTTSPFILALALGTFSSLKFDGLFYALIISVILLYSKEVKFFLTSLFFIVLNQLEVAGVNYIRFNKWFLQNPILISGHPNYILYCLFGPNGWFVKAPALIFIFIAMIYQSCTEEKIRDRLLMFSGISIVTLKALAVGTCIIPVTDYFANRVIVTEIPFFSYSLYLLYVRGQKFKKIFWLGVGLFSFYGLYSLSGWLFTKYAFFDYRLSYTFPLKILLNLNFVRMNLLELWSFFTRYFATITFLSGLSAAFLTINLVAQNKRPRQYRLIFLSAITLFSITFSLLNFSQNKKNVAKMKAAGEFRNVVVLKEGAIYFDEVMDMIEHGERVSAQIGVPSKSMLENFKNSYLKELEENIIYDPTNFSTDLKKGIIRKSFWQLKFQEALNKR